MKEIMLVNFLNPKTVDSVSGRDLGLEVREKLELESFDENSEVCKIVIPDTLENINPSYFLGLFGKSIRTLSEIKFREKYKFVITSEKPEVVKSLKEDIEVGIRRALKDSRGNNNAD